MPEIYEEIKGALHKRLIELLADWNLNSYGEATALKIYLLIAWPVGLPILGLANLYAKGHREEIEQAMKKKAQFIEETRPA
jgi:hypothetical protein